MRSIQSFLLVGLIAALTLISAVTGMLAYNHTEHEIEEIFDASLSQSAKIFHGLVVDHQERESYDELRESLHGKHGPWGQDHRRDAKNRENKERQYNLDNPGHRYESKQAFQAWGDDKELLLSTPPELDFPKPTVPGFETLTDKISGEQWRFYTLYDKRHALWIRSGQIQEMRQDITREIAEKALFPLLIGIPLLLLAQSLIVRRGLAPLTRIRRALDSRDSDDLTPVNEDGQPFELQKVTHALNKLFDRVNDTLSRERRFTDDAAHELRTPLAALSVHLENARMPDDQQNLMRQSINRMERVVTQLLELARLEPKRGHLQTTQVNLEAIAAEQMADLLNAADARQIELALEAPANIRVSGEATLIGVLIRNLLENAIRNTTERDEVRLVIELRHGAVSLRVIDHGPGIPAALRARVLERFYRMDKSAQEGAGLGFSIVALIAELHHCTLTLEETEGGGLTASVIWPVS